MRILDCYFARYIESETQKVTDTDIEDLEGQIEQLFIFSMIWSVGCTTDLAGREKFSQRLKGILPQKVGMPDAGFVYDYKWDMDKKEWIIWTQTKPEFNVDNRMAYGDIVVPTFDSIRMQFIKRLLLVNKKHLLCPGPTGTGKTVNIQIMLAAQMPEEYQYIPITFSAQTSANQT
jgi:dynein heavy chain